jgi:glycosyltransferase involved in cell wall biosynthesis
MFNNEKIGVGITTYNSESYFKTLFDSLKDDNIIDELVVVNGGEPYKEIYNCDWIQHYKNRFPSICRNDCISFLLNKDCEHIFLIEDDMIIKNIDIFKKYIEVSKITGLNYFSFVSMSSEAGSPGNRNPVLQVNYKDSHGVSFYQNMCNEFTYHHKSCFLKCGLYDGKMRDLFDADMVFRQSIANPNVAPFWYFADITDSDNYIENNPVAVSRLQADRPDGSRADLIVDTMHYFTNKHGIVLNSINCKTKEEVIEFLKNIKP